MKQPINTLRNWFKTGLFPTQSQFWDWMDSYWHKNDKIPASSIEGLSNVATKEDLDAAIQGVDNDLAVLGTDIDGNTKGIDALKAADGVMQASINSLKYADLDTNVRIDTLSLAKENVGTVQLYAELKDFNTSPLSVGDTVGVLTDETEEDRYSVYAWSGTAWYYIGSTAAYVPMAQFLADQTRVNGLIADLQTQVSGNKTQVDKISSKAVFNILEHPGVNPGTFTSFAKWSNTINNVGYNSQYIIGSQRGSTGRGNFVFFVGNDDHAMIFTRFFQSINKRIYVDQVTTASSLLSGDNNPTPIPNTLETFAWLSDLNNYLSKTSTTSQTVASYVTFTAGAGNVSDERFKKNRQQVESVLEKIKSIPIFEYDWDRDGDAPHRTLGVSAQDVQKHFPLIVKELDDVHKTLTLDYGKLAAIAIGGLNEAHQRIEKLELLVAQLMSKK